MKNTKFLLLLLSLVFVACGEYYGYDADKAESPYAPKKATHIVKSLKTTSVYNGYDYSWEHKFKYDKHNRIQEVTSNIKFYVEDKWEGTYVGYRKSVAKYYYLDNNIDVVYTVSFEYPDHPNKNRTYNGTDEGVFDSKKGVLKKYSALDLLYSGSTLTTVYCDGGRRYEIERDRNNNVTGYNIYDDYDNSLINSYGEYNYSSKENNTNFDFSGYLGYWGVEEELLPNASPYYAAYQLAAFGFMGTTGKNLPVGKPEKLDTGESITGQWELDDKGRPVLFTETSGRKTSVTY